MQSLNIPSFYTEIGGLQPRDLSILSPSRRPFEFLFVDKDYSYNVTAHDRWGCLHILFELSETDCELNVNDYRIIIFNAC